MEEGLAEYVAPVAPVMGDVQPAPVNHWYEYDGVPPEACETSWAELPLPYTKAIGLGEVIAPATSCETKTYVAVLDSHIWLLGGGCDPLSSVSLTRTQYDVLACGLVMMRESTPWLM